MNTEPQWLKWTRQLNSIARAGLTYCENEYDRERYTSIQELVVEILNHYTEAGETKIRELFTLEPGYVTPKIDIRAAVIRDDTILLVREKADGLWSWPGGWADVNRTLKENLIKEAREEAGVTIRPRRVIAIQERSLHNEIPLPYTVYKIFVECAYLSGEFKTNTETHAAGWFGEGQLPPLSTGRNTEAQVKTAGNR